MYMYIYIYIYVYVYMYIDICICIYVYIELTAVDIAIFQTLVHLSNGGGLEGRKYARVRDTRKYHRQVYKYISTT